ncbi:MAG TPA: hypothetical protein VIS07_01160 [Candidatus Binatia bacterium]
MTRQKIGVWYIEQLARSTLRTTWRRFGDTAVRIADEPVSWAYRADLGELERAIENKDFDAWLDARDRVARLFDRRARLWHVTTEAVITNWASLAGTWTSSVERLELRDGSSLFIAIGDPEQPDEPVLLLAHAQPSADLEIRRAVIEELLASRGVRFHAAEYVSDVRWCTVTICDPDLLDAARAGYRRAITRATKAGAPFGPADLVGASEAMLDEYTERSVQLD